MESSRMRAAGAPLTERPAWKALRAHHREVREVHLRRLFAEDPGRADRMTAEAAGFLLAAARHSRPPATGNGAASGGGAGTAAPRLARRSTT